MIAIVTDSTIYLTKQEATAAGVHIVPMTYIVGGRPMHEHYSDSNGYFEKIIGTFKCTTSQPSPAAFMSVFEELRRAGYDILCLVISSRLSGTFSSALIAAREIDAEKIRIVDSLTTAGGIKFLVERAKECIEKGLGLEETAAALEQMRDRIGIVFSVENMDPLRRSGRLGFIRQSIGTILNTRPILMCKEGTVISYDFAKGKSQQLRKLVDAVPKDAKKLSIESVGALPLKEPLLNLLKAAFPRVPISFNVIGPVLAIHLGIPSLGISWEV